jgi:hypothetical protein
MQTVIFACYKDFLSRTDKTVNGVSEDFAKIHPGWTVERSSQGCWNCADCIGCIACDNCVECVTCKYCGNCESCAYCAGCATCRRCVECLYISGHSDSFKAAQITLPVPVVPNIHATVKAAVAPPHSLNMTDWHSCETMHCRAGWVVVLAGEAGKLLEAQTSTLFAAMQIYIKSSSIHVGTDRFFDDDEKAMEDIQRCAELETSTSTLNACN